MIFNAFDLVVVPFPFTDLNATKRRPSLILSHARFSDETNHSVCAMVTSAKHSEWSGDTIITDLASAGLSSPSVVRFKIFTIDNRFVLKHIGLLSKADRDSVVQNVRKILPR